MVYATIKGIAKAAGLKKEEEKKASDKTKLKDESKMLSWAIYRIKKAYDADIMLGDNTDKFNPQKAKVRE